MPVYNNTADTVGRTPLMRLRRYEERHGLCAALLIKEESRNPTGSIKDRVAKAMLEDAEQRGLLRAGDAVVEPTSGNTGIGLAALGVAKGYRVILTMPDSMSAERRRLLTAYGAEIVLTPGREGMAGAIRKAEELAARLPAYLPGQFTNPANTAAHYRNTGPEIWQDTNGNVDLFVACVGTGGTITGTGRYLKEQNPRIRVIAVEPAGSPVLSKVKAGPHAIQGIGAGFVPAVLDTSVYDEVIAVSDADAFAAAKEVFRTCGVSAGISSGAALWAATTVAARPENAGKTVAVLFPDGGDRYYSTPIFTE